jgi:hypothetical protein
MSEWLLFDAISSICHLYHGENKQTHDLPRKANTLITTPPMRLRNTEIVISLNIHLNL